MAAQELRYRPNLLARAMVTRSTQTLGLIISDVANPYVDEIILAVEQAASTLGYSVFLCNSRLDPAVATRSLRLLASREVDGMLVWTSIIDMDSVVAVCREGTPVVVWDAEPPEGSGIPVLRADLEAGERAAVEHLLSLGHHQIAFVGGLERYLHKDRRLGAYQAALEAAGLPFDPELVQAGDYKIEGGRLALRRLLELPDPPTAVVTVSDATAIGVLHAARSAGLRVPDDLSVVGFDDVLLASVVDPPVTTVAIPRQLAGAAAVDLVARLIHGQPCPACTVLPTQLIVRASTGPPARLRVAR